MAELRQRRGADSAKEGAAAGATQSPTHYLLVVAGGESPLERCRMVAAALAAAHLTVSHHIEGGDIRLQVSAPDATLATAAEHLGFVKPRSTDGEMALFEAEAGDEFEGFGSASFWLPCEQASLLLTLIDDTLCAAAELERVGLQRSGKKSARSSAKDVTTTNLIQSLQASGVLLEKVPMPLTKPSGGSTAVELHEGFGPGVALYFGWLDCLTAWLRWPAGLGFVLYAHHATSGPLSAIHASDCGGGASAWYCALLPQQTYTVDDDPFLPLFSVFVVLWAAAFLAAWRQKCAALGWTFGLTQGDSATPSAVLAKEEPLPPPLLTLLTAYGRSVLVTGCM